MPEPKDAGALPRQARPVLSGIFALVALVFAIKTFRVSTVSGEEIGFLVNNWTGRIQKIETAGQVIYCGLWNDFYTIEKRRLFADLGVLGAKDDLVRLKTLDGNDVYVDFNVFYEIMPERALEILRENGPGKAYQENWVRDYGRAVCRYVFGELTTEEFYVADNRTQKMRQAERELNELLNPHGIRVVEVAVQRSEFRPEYRQKIEEKKIADQEVEQWRSRMRANEEQRDRLVEQARREMENDLTRWDGMLAQKLEQAKGEAARIRLEAEAQKERVERQAEAEFARRRAEAEGIRATLEAEAAGAAALREALSGDGGRNLVALEYARKLAGLTIRGRAVLLDGLVEQFRHEQAGAAAPALARPREAAAPARENQGGTRR